MTERENLLTSIAGTINDYRDDKIAAHPVARHIDRWISQFDQGVQVPMLRELDHVFQRTYVSQPAMHKFLIAVANRFAYDFWQSVYICNIQQRGRSQSKIIGLLDEILKQKYGRAIEHHEYEDGDLVYLDDAVFTGDHVINDLENIVSKISNRAQLYIIVIASHTYAEYRIKKKFARINVNVYFKQRFENRMTWHKPAGGLVPTDVLRPSEIGKRDWSARTSSIFSSVEGRELLERQFLNAGRKYRTSQETQTRTSNLLDIAILNQALVRCL